jgi:hypothetical protein
MAAGRRTIVTFVPCFLEFTTTLLLVITYNDADESEKRNRCSFEVLVTQPEKNSWKSICQSIPKLRQFGVAFWEDAS